MTNIKSFPFEKSRRITLKEIKSARRAIEKKTGVKRKTRGRPAKGSQKYAPTSIRLHPKVLSWAKKEGKNPPVPIVAQVNKPAPKPIDPKVQAMAQCLSNIQSALNEREKKKLLAAIGSKPAHILCNESYFSANSSVWDEEYPNSAFCYDTTDNSPKSLGVENKKIKEDKLYLYPEEEKDRRLKACERFLISLKDAPESALIEPVSKSASGQR